MRIVCYDIRFLNINDNVDEGIIIILIYDGDKAILLDTYKLLDMSIKMWALEPTEFVKIFIKIIRLVRII